MKRILLISAALPSLLLYMTQSFAHKEEDLTDINTIAKPLTLGERWGKKSTKAPKTVNFTQTAGDATSIAKISLRYFTASNCTGPSAGDFSTTGGTINTSPNFGLVATALFKVGDNKLELNMSTINSIGVILKSTTNNIPQASFNAQTALSCIQNVDCSTGSTCTPPAVNTVGFTLQTAAAYGQPADGGLIASLVSLGDATNFVVQPANNTTPKIWGGSGIDITNSESTTDGSGNTSIIVDCLTNGTGVAGCTGSAIAVGDYAAGVCSTHAEMGGYNSGWYLPATEELETVYDHRAQIGNISVNFYTSSVNVTSTTAYAGDFTGGTYGLFAGAKDGSQGVALLRCARALVVN